LEIKGSEFNSTQWALSDCIVKECIDGAIFVIEDKCWIMYKCPRCERLEEKYKGKIKTYTGTVSLHSKEEMGRRLDERREIVTNPEFRWKRGKEVMGGLCGFFDKPKPMKEDGGGQ
jgi:phage FluMu protein Com